MIGLGAVNPQRTADVPGCEHSGGRFDHPIGIHLRQRHAFVHDGFDLEAALEQFGEELLARDGIVGQVIVRLFVALEWDRVFDVVFCE